MSALSDLTGAFDSFQLLAPCRELVLAAFDRRPEWQVTVQNTDCAGAAAADDSLFYWGEYETIDWEQVHAGEASVLCIFPPIHLVLVPSQYSVDFVIVVQLRPTACLLLLLPKGLDQKSTPMPQHQEVGS